MFKLLRIFAVFSLCFLLTSGTAQAGEEKQWYDSVVVSGGFTAILQGTAGIDDSTAGAETEDEANFSHSLDLTGEFELAPNHMFVVYVESGEGDGIESNFAGFTTIGPNYDAANTHDDSDQDLTVAEVFYEGTFFDGRLTFDMGKMDIHALSDENNFAGDETTQFLASMFVRLPGTIFAELDNYYSPGIRLLIAPFECFELTYIAANSNNEEVTDSMYHVGQINIKPNIMGLEGNYRFYAIQDERDYTKINNTSDTNNSNFGWGVSFDQLITENIGLFFRYGSQDHFLVENTVTEVWNGGVSINGNIWKRSDDFIGIGYGVAEKNKRIATAYSDDQRIFEIFYHFQLFDNLAITPDIQFHEDLPRTNNRNVAVYGLRAQFDFF